ncbi:MAG: prolyl oligopeptidase family serine peptidase, partial [Planctomycetales bacterium]|nr:prolyl oligopeptidase family serine peptidase [Planctomycetales bacterium]
MSAVRLLVGIVAFSTFIQTLHAEESHEFSTEVVQKLTLKYLVIKPNDFDPQKKYPLILFLHGAGERGDDLQRVKIHGPYKKVAELNLPVIIVAPQCPAGQWWNPDAVAALTRHCLETLPVDPQRVYLTGLSMGGFGTWATSVRTPELYAAIAPICGGGEPDQAAKLKGMPIWAFHGLKDTTVPAERTKDMAAALDQAGIEYKLTLYPEAGHDSWTETY